MHPFLVFVLLCLAGGLSPAGALSESLPAPESVLGFEPCADGKLATYEEIAEYFRVLNEATDRMRLVEIGKTAEGRAQLMSIISSAENLEDIDRYKEISGLLARAKGLDDDQAARLAAEGKAIVWIDFGLHSTERAHAQTAPWMAYKAVSEESEEMRSIREEVIFLLLPNMNPDGTTLVADWHREYRDTPYAESGPVELYQKYVGHDNNRDWFMYNQPETRNVGWQLYHEWYPQLIYNQHQEAPFPARIFLPPFEDPMNPNIPPLVMRGINLVGEAMSRRFDQEGKSGALSRVSFDTWWNGGMRTAPYFHNMIGILTETAHSSPSPATYDPEKFPKTFSTGVSTLEPSTFYPRPYQGGEWHFRDSCEYMITGSMAVLDIGAKRRREWLYDIYRMGRDAIDAGSSETYVISADQWDRGTATKLVNVLRWGGVEVERASDAFEVSEQSFPAGSYLIRGAQPFRPYLTDLLNPQVYPDRRLFPGGPPELPYDITGWTLPLQMGVDVEKIDSAVEVASEPVDWAKPDPGQLIGSGRWGWAVDPRPNDAFTLVNRLLAGGISVVRMACALELEEVSWPPGAFLIERQPGVAEVVDNARKELGVDVAALTERPESATHPVPAQRIGLYHAWGGNMDEGWTRWVLEQFEFDLVKVYDADIRVGDLRDRFDVLVLPDSSWQRMLTGLDRATTPERYAGGMTTSGSFAVYEFVASGGTLVAMDSAAELPLTLFGLPIRDVTTGRQDDKYFIPGTLVRLEVDAEHPLGYGLPGEVSAFFARSPAFRIGRRPSRRERQRSIEPEAPDGVTTAASWPDEDLLQSGWLLGEDVIAGKAAVVDAELGEGRVVLLGLRVQHRGQSHGTFKLLFNALYR